MEGALTTCTKLLEHHLRRKHRYSVVGAPTMISGSRGFESRLGHLSSPLWWWRYVKNMPCRFLRQYIALFTVIFEMCSKLFDDSLMILWQFFDNSLTILENFLEIFSTILWQFFDNWPIEAPRNHFFDTSLHIRRTNFKIISCIRNNLPGVQRVPKTL